MFILLQSQLEDALSEKAAKEEQFKKEIEDLQSRISQLDSEKEACEKRQREDLAQLHRDLIGKVALCIMWDQNCQWWLIVSLSCIYMYIHDILQILANIKKAPQYSFTITDYDSDMICYEKYVQISPVFHG